MDVTAVGSGNPGSRPLGVTAQLAEARRMLRAATPAGSEDAVGAAVQRLRDHGAPMLAALHAVHTKLATGWTPPGA